MKQIKAGKPLIDFIKLCYAANRPPLLIGPHGCGKSMLLEQAAKELNISYICRDLSLMEPPDLVGMPKLDGGVTRFLPPSFLPTEGKGLLCFEELNRCPNYMRAPCLQLLTARCLNDYRLPDGWLPCAAINPSEANYEVNDLDPALLSRFVKVLVIPDKTEWIKWAKENGISKEITGYVGYDSKVFTDTSPRDWVYVNQLMKAQKESNGITRDILGIAVQGVVGKERAAAFSQYLKSGILLPPVVEILTDYSKYQEQIKELRNNGKTDVLGNVTHELMMYLQDIDNYKHLHNKAEGLWTALRSFLSDLPADNAKQVEKFMKDKKYEIPVNPLKSLKATWSLTSTLPESVKAPTLEDIENAAQEIRRINEKYKNGGDFDLW